MGPLEPWNNRFDPLQTPTEAAAYLGVPKSRLTTWRRDKATAPRALKAYNTVRYRLSDLDTYLKFCPGPPSPSLTPTHVLPPDLVELQEAFLAFQRRARAASNTTSGVGLLPDPSLRLDEACRYLAIPKATIYTWRTTRPEWGPQDSGYPSLLTYQLSDLNAWIQQHLEPAPPYLLAVGA